MQPNDYDYSFDEKRRVEHYLAEAEKDALVKASLPRKHMGWLNRFTLSGLVLPRNNKASQFK